MSDPPLRSFIFGSCTKQVDAQRCVEACCGKHAETLHNAEICGRDELYPERTDEHHTECDPGADPIGAAMIMLSDTMDSSTTAAVTTICMTS